MALCSVLWRRWTITLLTISFSTGVADKKQGSIGRLRIWLCCYCYQRLAWVFRVPWPLPVILCWVSFSVDPHASAPWVMRREGPWKTCVFPWSMGCRPTGPVCYLLGMGDFLMQVSCRLNELCFALNPIFNWNNIWQKNCNYSDFGRHFPENKASGSDTWSKTAVSICCQG